MKNNQERNDGVITLLRICTVLLSAVSFWATAQGMKEYTFPKDWQAFAASLGIQGLLLGLNFALPTFLRKCTRVLQKVVLLCLTGVVLFCSSWFSYLYIAQQAYKQSWDVESQLLSQESYQNELFSADTYLEQYGEKMEQALADHIIVLYNQAANMDSNKVDIAENLDWDNERSVYAQDNFAARDIMLSIIAAMEQATGENATQDEREQSADIVDSMQTALQNAISSLDTQIESADASVARAESSLISAQNRMYNAPANTDLTPYQSAVATAARAYETSISRQATLVSQRQDYQSALQRTSYYSSILGMSDEGVSSYFVGTNLREIQSELFGTDPDTKHLMELTTNIFNRLQNAVDLGADESNVNYQTFLSSMNQFASSLENYDSIKELKAEIQSMIDQLAAGTVLPLNDKGANWKSDWQTEFNKLKSKISGIPVYVLADNSIELESFDRSASVSRLDDTIRKYLTDHNPAQEGLIYLYSPYRDVAIFSLFVAFLFDISAFITGFIIDRESSSKKNSRITPVEYESDDYDDGTAKKPLEWDLAHTIKWNAMPPLNRYIFLTGDHQFLDGIMTYRAVENGEVNVVQHPSTELSAGFYLWKDNDIQQVQISELRYKGADGGPQDGIYVDAVLHYDDQLLSIVQNKHGIHLGTVDPYTPVYKLSEENYDMIHAKDIQDEHGSRIVVSLNQEGTRIIAIYIIAY